MYTGADYERISLGNALKQKNFIRAFEKIEDNIKFINTNIANLLQQASNMKKNKENDIQFQNNNENIESTKKTIDDTFTFLNDIKNFNYSSNKDKNLNLNKANKFEKDLQSRKKDFDSVVNKINYFRNNKNNPIELDDTANYRPYKEEEDIKLSNDYVFLGEKHMVEDIQDKAKQIEIITKVTEQINDLSKKTAEVVTRTGEQIDYIEDNVEKTNNNIANAVEHMKKAKEANESTSNYSNYCFYVVIGVVVLLIFLVIIMPSN